MKLQWIVVCALVGATMGLGQTAIAAVSTEEAAQLKTTLTPMGGERAGNKDGTIPEWTGVYTTPIPGFKNGGRRPDPFANEKPLFSINAQNMDKYADKLTDGTKVMLKKYPTYRIDVYKTYRTAGAPQWVYDNTAKNATHAKLTASRSIENAYGGVPFPIPKSGEEVMWNHLLRWRGETGLLNMHGILITSDGRSVLTTDSTADIAMPYYYKEAESKFVGDFWNIRLIDSGPPIRAGEGITQRNNLDPDKEQTWVYLAGQRRTRKLPNACCDTPAANTAGVMSFDDLEVFLGRLDRFDWKIIGKKEMYIPYNTNKTFVPTKDSDVIAGHHLNPDQIRWELHRVWVVEATLAQGKRNVVAKSRYYVDEDSWLAVLGDRWDAKGQLWKMNWQLPMIMPDIPAVIGMTFGFYDLVSGAAFYNAMINEKPSQYKIMPHYQDSTFTPDALSGQSLR